MFGATGLRQALTPVALAVVSLLAAVALWVAVTDAENPTSDYTVPVALRIEAVGVPEGLAVRSITPDAIRVTVRATDEVAQELTAADFHATVDVTGIRDAESTQAVTVDILADEEIEIVETTSQFTVVTLENETSKTVPVQVNRLGSQAPGFFIATVEPNPAEVEVTGAASNVALVEAAVAEINLTGLRSTIQQTYNLTPRDASGAEIPRVRIAPSSAEIRLNVQQQDTPVILPVVPQPQGQVAEGYNIQSVSADPQVVLVSGPIELLQGLDNLQTAEIDISGATSTVTRSVPLNVPSGLVVPRSNVTVTIVIEPAPGSRAIAVAPVVENVPENLNPVIQTTSLTVRVSGPTPVLNDLTAGSIRAVVSAEGLAEGVHVLPVNVTVPNNVTLVAVEPPQAVVALRP